jgi:Zn-dependent peptidase ImmA (M78 family)
MDEKLIKEMENEDIEVVTIHLSGQLKGLYADNVIAISKQLKTSAERTCILAEELGHHYTSSGNILDQSKIENRKQELKARRWAVQKLIKVEDFIKAFEAGVRNRAELAEFLEVTEAFIATSLKHFKSIYGFSCSIDNYIITFDPLCVYKHLDRE